MQTLTQHYTENYYEIIRSHSERSAATLAPLLIQLTRCKSIIDVGCGDGSWLSFFAREGITDFVGVDGDYVDRNILRIPQDRFRPYDLKKPFRLDRTFDLAMSLEVAEHLPTETSEAFVASLTSLAPIVVFSAAYPCQGGEDHINEQRPEFWADLFHQQGYEAVDCIRKRIWHDERIQWWYTQNVIMYVRRDYLETDSFLRAEAEKTDRTELSRIHPGMHLYYYNELAKAQDIDRITLRKALQILNIATRNMLKRRINRLKGRS